LESRQYYAALNEWGMGERKPHDFSANMFLDVYNANMATLNKIESVRNVSYHKMMVEIYQFAM
jgi:hypothetical protein